MGRSFALFRYIDVNFCSKVYTLACMMCAQEYPPIFRQETAGKKTEVLMTTKTQAQIQCRVL